MLGAENLPGLKEVTEVADCTRLRPSTVVREHSDRAEAEGVSHRGAFRSENVGISSKKTGENPVHRKPKVSRATRIVPGLVGPKARPKGVADGQQVNIPALA